MRDKCPASTPWLGSTHEKTWMPGQSPPGMKIVGETLAPLLRQAPYDRDVVLHETGPRTLTGHNAAVLVATPGALGRNHAGAASVLDAAWVSGR